MHSPASISQEVETGSFRYVATSSFYGTLIKPPIELEVTFELFEGRPVFQSARDNRGLLHEVELLNQAELNLAFSENS